MLTTGIELLVILSAALSSAALLQKAPAKARRVHALSFILAFAVGVAFSLAQLGVQLRLLELSLACTPLDGLSLLAVIHWLARLCAESPFFNCLLGE